MSIFLPFLSMCPFYIYLPPAGIGRDQGQIFLILLRELEFFIKDFRPLRIGLSHWLTELFLSCRAATVQKAGPGGTVATPPTGSTAPTSSGRGCLLQLEDQSLKIFSYFLAGHCAIEL
jgi:hypothetical protein